MAKIYNSFLTKGLAKNAGIQINSDKVPNELAEKVVPTMETNPDILAKGFYKSTLSSDATTVIYTTSTTKETYVTSCDLTMVKTAGNNATYVRIQAVDNDGGTFTLARLPCIAATAGSGETFNIFPKPILLRKGSNISLVTDDATATIRMHGGVGLYENESGA